MQLREAKTRLEKLRRKRREIMRHLCAVRKTDGGSQGPLALPGKPRLNFPAAKGHASRWKKFFPSLDYLQLKQVVEV